MILRTYWRADRGMLETGSAKPGPPMICEGQDNGIESGHPDSTATLRPPTLGELIAEAGSLAGCSADEVQGALWRVAQDAIDAELDRLNVRHGATASIEFTVLQSKADPSDRLESIPEFIRP